MDHLVGNRKIAIIPARGGSKRLPGKNIMDFYGKPMIAWTIEAALETEIFDKVFVSTDDKDIAAIAETYGARVPFLRRSKYDDYSTVSEATIESLKQLDETGVEFDLVFQLMAVTPLRNSKDILDAYSFFIEKHADFLISCNRFIGANAWWALSKNEEGEGKWIFREKRKRSQDLQELFSPNGSIWIAKIPRLFEEGTFYGKNQVYWELDWNRAVDIDTVEDLHLAKALKHFNEDQDNLQGR